MAAFKIPQPIVQFPGGAALPDLPSMSFNDPAEGKRFIPVGIAWPGAATVTSYDVNVGGLTTQPFSQIVMLDVDNSQCGVAVTFMFPDSQDTLVVAAESSGLFPVFTNSLKFYVAAPGNLASDITRFRLLNYRQEPVSGTPPQLSSVATALGLSGAGTTALIGSGVSGTLTGYSVGLALVAAGAGTTNWTVAIVDHATSNVIDQTTVSVAANSVFNGIIMFANPIAVRFGGGVDVVITVSGSAPTSASTNVTARYHTP